MRGAERRRGRMAILRVLAARHRPPSTGQPFRPVVAMPSVIQRWKRMKMIRTGSDEDDGAGHEHPVVGLVLAGGERRERDRQRVHVRFLGHHERVEEAVPAAEEGQDPERREDRHGDRHDDLPEDPPLVRPVDPGGLEQLVRDADMNWRVRKTPNGPTRNGRIRPGYVLTSPRLLIRTKFGIRVIAGRDHQRREDETHDQALAAPLELGERVAEHRAEQDVADGDDERDHGRVEEEAREVELAEEPLVVVDRRRPSAGTSAC